jgi:hypothetical protein
MSPVCVVSSFLFIIIDFDRINILRRAYCLASPLHAHEHVLGGVAGVHGGSFPCSEQVLGPDRLEIVKCDLDIIGRKILVGD